MAQFRDSLGNLIDTLGQSQPSSAANSPAPQAKSVPASQNAGTTFVSDIQVYTSTTIQPVADRA